MNDIIVPELKKGNHFKRIKRTADVNAESTLTKRRTTTVFAKAGLDNVTSAKCKHQQRFGLDVQCLALVLNFNNIFLPAGRQVQSAAARADGMLIPNLRKALLVVYYVKGHKKGSIF